MFMNKKVEMFISPTFFQQTKVINDVKLNGDSLTNEQTAIQEVAYAYYRKGRNLQYDFRRKSFNATPEEITSQNNTYFVCGSFVYSVYKQTFGIELPSSTFSLIAYAYQNKDQDDIVLSLYGSEFKDQVSTSSLRTEFSQKLLNEYNLSVGDIIVWHTGAIVGHVLMVYDIIYDSNGSPVDATIIHSTNNYETDTNKLTKGLSYSNDLNSETGIYEGTIKVQNLERTVYDARNKSYFSIIRPLLTNENGEYTGQYYVAQCTSSSSGTLGYICSANLANYAMIDATQSRLKYSGIDIEKTVDKFNKSNVRPGDTLTYIISITNNSNAEYTNLSVIENISEYIEVSDSGGGTLNNNILSWNINIPAGTTYTINYSVKIKNDRLLIGNTITSTGKVDNIATSTVINYISNSLIDLQKTQIVSAYNQLINSDYQGKNLINEIYKKALDVDLNLNDLDITDLIQTTVSDSLSSIVFNENNSFSDMVLENYYGAIYTSAASSTISLKYWESPPASAPIVRSERNDTIYNENFQTGDILIYKNKQDAFGDMIAEDGEYAFIYIEDVFYGNNENENNQYSLEPYSTNGNDNLQTLLAKDYYVILRPAKIMPYIEQSVEESMATETVNVPPTAR